MKILSSNEIKDIEKQAAENLAIPEIILMENAGCALYDEIKKRVSKKSNIAFLCGYGNNAGDGFVAARKLLAEGYYIKIFHPEDENKFSTCAKINFNILQKMDAPTKAFQANTTLQSYDILVDCLFGIGLSRPIKDVDGMAAASLIETANKHTALKIAVDIPSGLFADRSTIENTVFKADVTITFSALKFCLSLYPTKELAGEIVLKNISIPDKLLGEINRQYLTMENLPKLTHRKNDSHKGDYGSAFILGGSADMAGACCIAAAASLKIGAGLTYLGVNDETGLHFLSNYPEIILKRWNLNEPASVIDFINKKATVLLIGCGMGTAKDTTEFIKEIVFNVKKPLIIDADGINCLTIADLKKIHAPFALTPHLKEFSRLLGEPVDNIKNGRVTLARNFAKSNNCLLMLKSADTVIANREGNISVADFGTPALAKGGSGDSLAGTFAGLLCQGYSIEDAAKLSVFINGQAAKYASKEQGLVCVRATDVINNFGKAINDIHP